MAAARVVQPARPRLTLDTKVPVVRDTDKYDTSPYCERGPGRACLIVLSGGSTGALHVLDAPITIIGRSRDADIVVEDSCASKRHARIFDQGGTYVIEDLGSRNGLFVNGKRTTRAPLQSCDRVQLGAATVFKFASLSDTEVAFHRRLHDSAVKDPVTGVYNVRFFQDALAGELAYAARQKMPTSVLLLDIDRFKAINDTHGHPAGDAALKAVARLVARDLRREDVLCRYGGDEFAVMLRNTNADVACAVADRIRRRIAGSEVPGTNGELRLTVSIGIATSHGDGVGPAEVIAMADTFLYDAKRAGRDCAASGRPRPRPVR
jgi:diguanylate cyclase (GGDEF)-like protein